MDDHDHDGFIYSWKTIGEPQLMVTNETFERAVKFAFLRGLKCGFLGGIGLMIWFRLFYWLIWEIR